MNKLHVTIITCGDYFLINENCKGCKITMSRKLNIPATTQNYSAESVEPEQY